MGSHDKPSKEFSHEITQPLIYLEIKKRGDYQFIMFFVGISVYFFKIPFFSLLLIFLIL